MGKTSTETEALEISCAAAIPPTAMVSSKAVVRHTFIVCVSWVAPGNQRDAAAGIAVAEGLAVGFDQEFLSFCAAAI